MEENIPGDLKEKLRLAIEKRTTGKINVSAYAPPDKPKFDPGSHRLIPQPNIELNKAKQQGGAQNLRQGLNAEGRTN